MSGYMHRVHGSEVASSLLPVVSVASAIPFIIGTAPVNMTDGNCNEVIRVENYSEAFARFGYVPPRLDESSGLKKFDYSISEFMRSQFQLFGIGPAFIVNVLDPTQHKKTCETTEITLDTKKATVTVEETGILLDTLELTTGESVKLKIDEDFIAAFDDDGFLVLTSLKNQDGDFRCPTGSSITFAAEQCDPTKVTTDDIIGGISTVSGKEVLQGLELIEQVFPKYGEVPGFILAPGFSHNAELAAVMSAKCTNINSVFKCICLIDAPTETIKAYSDVPEWKNTNNIVDSEQVLSWPLIQIDGTVYHISTQLAALMGEVDGDNGGVPCESPSNKTLNATGAVLSDGSEITMTLPNAEYLNGNGIVTTLNFIGGHRAFGNRTACYPANTDPKDAFIPIRRMFYWINNTIVQTCWQRLDKMLNRRQIQTVQNSLQIWLNGLVARERLIAAKIEFREDENTVTELADGICRFHVTLTPPSPNREMEFIFEYDATALQQLFS